MPKFYNDDRVTDLHTRYGHFAGGIAYAGVILDQASKQKLLDATEDLLDQPILEQPFAHHITLKFKPSAKMIHQLNYHHLNQTVNFTATYLYADEKGQAITVQFDDEDIANLCHNRHPHITIATTTNVPPAYSNELIAKRVPEAQTTLHLTGRIGLFAHGRSHYALTPKMRSAIDQSFAKVEKVLKNSKAFKHDNPVANRTNRQIHHLLKKQGLINSKQAKASYESACVDTPAEYMHTVRRLVGAA